MNSDTEPEFLKGTVQRITFRNEETGFGVVRADADGRVETVVGIVPDTIKSGSTFIARGAWHTHNKFGRQFKAYSIVETEPTSSEAVLRYLSSGAVKGIGPQLAGRIVSAFGEETLRILDHEPGRLRSVPGIGEKKFREIMSVWNEKKNSREVLLFFQNYGITAGLAQRIQRAYGERAIEVVRENPYILCDEVWGIGFQTADKIAGSIGIHQVSGQRIRAGIQHILKSAAEDGHCYLPQDVLLSRLQKLLGIEDEEKLRTVLSQCAAERSVVSDAQRIYSLELFSDEQSLASCIAWSAGRTPLRPVSEKLVNAVCEEPVRVSDAKVIALSEEQKQALRYAAARSLLVITGGPGCGKTTLVRAISALFRRAGLTVKLAAPTGRAAQRLAEVCGMEASTIHRLLRYDPNSRSFQYGEHDPLELDALIVDESSMIDLPLAASLFRAVPLGARIVVVGDADQLPSVGPGLFLGDLLGIENVPRVRLTSLFRRANESMITTAAHQVNAGDIPDVPSPDGVTRTDAYFLSASSPEDCAQLIERLVVEQIPKKFGFQPPQITVLSPMNQGDIGVIALNRRLQGRLINQSPANPSVRVGERKFWLGDRVCQRVNNYNLGTTGVFNGDQGEVIGIDPHEGKVYVKLWDGREVEYGADNLDELDLAYALSIHRSQGSEVPAVVLILHDSHTIMLERQLLYTAMTRAKQLLIIVGTKRALVLAVKRMRSKRRYSNLIETVSFKLRDR